MTAEIFIFMAGLEMMVKILNKKHLMNIQLQCQQHFAVMDYLYMK